MTKSDDVPTLRSLIKTNSRSVVPLHATGIKLQVFHYCRCYPNTPIVFAVAVCVVLASWIVPRLFVSPVAHSNYEVVQVLAVCFFVGALILLRPSISRTIEGAICPAVVLDSKSGWIAVFADMSSEPQRRFVPAIKVIRIRRLTRAAMTPLKTGDRITSICTHVSDTMGGNPIYWSDLRPVPVVCATRNQGDIDRSHADVAPQEWRILEQYAGLVPQPFEEDLHCIDLAKSTFFGPGDRRLVVGYRTESAIKTHSD